MNSMQPGGGGRFQQMTAGGMSPGLAAFIGRKKYGKGRFQQMSAKGRKRHHGHQLAKAAAGGKRGVVDPDGIPNNGDEYRIVNGRKIPVR